MPLPAPTFLAAHAVLQTADLLPRDPGRDDALIAALKGEFPNLLSRQLLPPEVPAQTPHLVLASTSSQLAMSSAQADFEVRFYGDFPTDLTQALEYVERKLLAILGAYESAGATLSTVGVIGTLHFSFKDIEDEPASHILRNHLRTDAPPEDVQDALARIAVRIRDTYFVTMTLSNYEERLFERPLMPGMTQIRVRPWEAELRDQGVELALDINNNLEGRVARADPVLTDEGIRAVVRLLREVALTAGPAFAESGTVSIDDLVASSTP